VKAQGDMFQATSKSQTNGVQDEFNFRMRLVSDKKWVMSSNLIYATQQDQNRSDVQFAFDLFYLVEFHCNDTHPIYVGDESTVLSVWPKEQKVQWDENTDWDPKEVDDHGVLRRSWTRVSKDGVLTIRIHIDQLIANGTNVKFLPNSVKYDIDINNFPWTSTESRVALITKVSTLTTPPTNNCSNDCIFNGTLVTFSDTYGHPLGVFAWDPNVKVDKSKMAPVVAYLKSNDDNDDNLHFYFTFKTIGQSKTMYWDPMQGLDYNNPGPSSLSAGIKFLIAVSCFAFVAFVVSGVILYRRYTGGRGYTKINDGT